MDSKGKNDQRIPNFVSIQVQLRKLAVPEPPNPPLQPTALRSFRAAAERQAVSRESGGIREIEYNDSEIEVGIRYDFRETLDGL
jgi:hypothetical protein